MKKLKSEEKIDIIEFAEKYLGLQLLHYQKLVLKALSKGEIILGGRIGGKRTMMVILKEYEKFKAR